MSRGYGVRETEFKIGVGVDLDAVLGRNGANLDLGDQHTLTTLGERVWRTLLQCFQSKLGLILCTVSRYRLNTVSPRESCCSARQ